MSRRARNFAGVFALLAVLIGYAALASALYTSVLQGAPTWVLLPYFALAGMGWVFPASFIIKWMVRPDDDTSSSS